MKTPEQIRDMEFQKSPMGGYKQSDVELFLEEVASQIEILMKQKADADRKLQEFSQKAPEAALSATSIQNVLVNAQRVADQIVEDAKASVEQNLAEADLKLTEADIKSREMLAEAESKAVLLCETAEAEAAKIIANAIAESETIIAAAKESVELEQKLYDRLIIEVADFKKKAAAQSSALVELINQLPGEIPFNMERSKTVLSVDFSDPEQLLKNAVEERLAKDRAVAEAQAATEADAELEETAKPIEEPMMVDFAKEEDPAPIVEPSEDDESESIPAANDTEFADDAQMSFEAGVSVKISFDDDEENDDDDEADEEFENVETVILEPVAEEAPEKTKGRISFSDDDDDDDEDDEPRLFFRRKKK